MFKFLWLTLNLQVIHHASMLIPVFFAKNGISNDNNNNNNICLRNYSYIDMHYCIMQLSSKTNKFILWVFFKVFRQADMLGQNCSEVVCNEIILFFQEAGLEGRSGGLIN